MGFANTKIINDTSLYKKNGMITFVNVCNFKLIHLLRAKSTENMSTTSSVTTTTDVRTQIVLKSAKVSIEESALELFKS